MKYSIGEVTFKTQKAALEYARAKIYGYGVGRYSVGSEQASFLFDLLDNHHEKYIKLGTGVAYFHIVPNETNRKALATYIEHPNGEVTDFSWAGCAKNNTTKSYDAQLAQAMRNEIVGQILSFKNCSEKVCESCGYHGGDLHVDHVTPFKNLARSFLVFTEFPKPQKFTPCPVNNSPRFSDQDEAFADDWAEYHSTYSDLQILCATCNLKKGTKS
jgi:5-methylcytosine-specific restriction endonuclease McrA